jgi:hypothetical protein
VASTVKEDIYQKIQKSPHFELLLRHLPDNLPPFKGNKQTQWFLVRKRTIPIEGQPLASEVSANCV